MVIIWHLFSIRSIRAYIVWPFPSRWPYIRACSFGLLAVACLQHSVLLTLIQWHVSDPLSASFYIAWDQAGFAYFVLSHDAQFYGYRHLFDEVLTNHLYLCLVHKISILVTLITGFPIKIHACAWFDSSSVHVVSIMGLIGPLTFDRFRRRRKQILLKVVVLHHLIYVSIPGPIPLMPNRWWLLPAMNRRTLSIYRVQHFIL